MFQGVPGDPATDIFAPVDDSVELRVEREGTTARLTWRDDTSWRANVFYRVSPRRAGAGHLLLHLEAWRCTATSRERQSPRRATRRSSTTRPADATYRIGIGTNWVDDPEFGDVRVQSARVRIRLTRSSSRAMRCARSTFSSVSFEITVE